MTHALLDKYGGNIERLGFILEDGEIVEFENIAPNPQFSFEASAEAVMTFEDRAIASWHTHPGASANLSAEDAVAFKSRPDWLHYIVGNDGVRCFRVEHGRVVVHEP
jgi:proteasome lid subunit RPN8/RPN11